MRGLGTIGFYHNLIFFFDILAHVVVRALGVQAVIHHFVDARRLHQVPLAVFFNQHRLQAGAVVDGLDVAPSPQKVRPIARQEKRLLNSCFGCGL